METTTKTDIEKISYNLLKESNSFDIYPTPVDRLVEYSELVVSKHINIATIHESYLKKATNALFKAINKVRGLLDRTNRTIIIDQSLMPSRKNFVTIHEIGHGILPWQKKIHDVIEDDDESLSHHTIEEFEAEANFFASVTLFQHDRFITEINKLNLGIDSAMYLSKRFGASIHATLRRFVECSAKRCALIVLDKVTVPALSPACLKRDYFFSKRFFQTFGQLNLPNEFDMNWDFVRHYFHGKRGIASGIVSVLTESETVDFHYHFFNNSYNAFVFLYPHGEKQNSRTKIIITEAL